MMLKTVTFVFLVVCVLSASGSFFNVPAGHPDHPGKCWFAEKEIEMEAGDKITALSNPVFHCIQYTCVKNDHGFDFTRVGFQNNENGDYYFHRVGCAEFKTYCGYRTQEGDPKKPYPDCCPTAVEDKSQICDTRDRE